jgi:hypothetical protein
MQDRRRIRPGEQEIGLVALVLLAGPLVAGGDDPAFVVEQEDRAGADLLAEALEPLLGAAVFVRAQCEDQDRVAGEQERDDRVPLHRALDRSGIERRAECAVDVLVLGEGAGQIAVARPDDEEGSDHAGDDAHARPDAPGRSGMPRRCASLAHDAEQ